MTLAEKKTILSVLVLYLSSTLLLILSLGFTYYHFQQEAAQQKAKTILQNKAQEILDTLESLHQKSFANRLHYPRYNTFESAIYDIDKNLLFSTFDVPLIDISKQIDSIGEHYYYSQKVHPHYLGAAYLLVRTKIPTDQAVYQNIVVLGSFVFILIAITSYFLVKLMLKPIRQNLKQMDKFIKDTTHELNTPVSTILANIELLENQKIEPKFAKKIRRIKTASFTLSHIYEDLVFLILNHTLASNNRLLDVNTIINERLEYFSLLLEQKNIVAQVKTQDTLFVNMDQKKLERVIDNLLSNAIKYSAPQTTIQITTTSDSFTICDEGKGMTQEQIDTISKRYTRFDTIQGGFGIGFNIISSIAKEYSIQIHIDSTLHKGTCICLDFS